MSVTRLLVPGRRPGTIPCTDGAISIPEHWRVWNAPRPLMGTTDWIGECRHGTLYAACDPDDERTPACEAYNAKMDGWLIEWVDDAEVERRVRAALAVSGRDAERAIAYCAQFVEHPILRLFYDYGLQYETVELEAPP